MQLLLILLACLWILTAAEEIQVMELDKVNPFFDDHTAIITTPVISVRVLNDSVVGKRLPIEYYKNDEPFEYSLPLGTWDDDLDLIVGKFQNSVTLKPLGVDGSELDPWIQPFHLILSYNMKVKVVVQDPPMDMEFVAVIVKEGRPEVNDYCDGETRIILNKANHYEGLFETTVVGLNEVPKERFMDYYVGIYPYLTHGKFYQNKNFTVYFKRTSCLYRNEDENYWSEKGCLVMDKSTPKELHCMCNHASTFAGTDFIVPYDFDVIETFDFAPEDFDKNPIVLYTVVTVLVMYVVFLMLCFILDVVEDRRRVGIVIMGDLGDDCEQSYYLITVVTGTAIGAHTTASVSMQIYGKKGRSKVYVLREKGLSVLHRGGIDSYLVSSKNDLGELERIRIWSDNVGNSPSWFCRKIIIQDVRSSSKWYFVIESWMSLSGMKSQVIIHRELTNKEDKKRFSRRFKDTLMDHFDNTLLWINIIRRPHHNRFTRCERLSVAFAVLLFYMFLNILFEELALFREDKEQTIEELLVISVQVTLIAIPLGWFLVRLFRCTVKSYVPTLIMNEAHANPMEAGESTETGGDMAPSAMAVDEDDSTSNCSIPSTNIEDLENWIGDGINRSKFKRRNRFTRCVDESDDETTQQKRLAMGRLGLIHAVRAINPKTFIFKGEHDVPQVEKLIDEEILTQMIKPLPSMEGSSRNRKSKTYESKGMFQALINEVYLEQIYQELNDTQKEDTIQLKVNTLNQKANKRCWITFEVCKVPLKFVRGCFLSFGGFITAWLMTLGVMAGSVFGTLYIGQSYDYYRGFDWLMGVFASLGFSVVLLPLSAVIICLINTIIWPKKEEHVFQVWNDSSSDSKHIDRRKGTPMKYVVINPDREYPPLSGKEICLYKIEARRNQRIWLLFLKFLFYGLILIPLLIISHDGESSDTFYLTENLRTLFQLKDEFTEITNKKTLYDYLEDICIPALYPDEYYNGDTIKTSRTSDVYLNDGQTILLGVPRLRQVRLREVPCNFAKSLDKLYSDCFPPYSLDTQDKTSYYTSWEPLDRPGRKDKKNAEIWKYQDVSQSSAGSREMTGRMGRYDGSGYSVELGRLRPESESVIEYLKDYHWIDHRTRALFIEITVLNPNTNIYADVILLVEHAAAEAFTTNYYITPIVLNYSRQTPLLIQAAHVILVVAIAFLLFFVLWSFLIPFDARFESYRKLLGLFDWIVITCILLSLGIGAKTYSVELETLEEVEGMKINQYISLQQVANWDMLQQGAFSTTQCICFLKLWTILMMFDEGFLVTFLTVRLALSLILAFLATMLILLIAFASMGRFLFGTETQKFSTFVYSFITLLDQMINLDISEELQDAHPLLGAGYFAAFSILIVFIATTLIHLILTRSMKGGKNISRETVDKWKYKEAIHRIFQPSIPYAHELTLAKTTALQPYRLKMLKSTTASYFRESLNRYSSQNISKIKELANIYFKGTGCTMRNKNLRRVRITEREERRINKMRMIAAELLRKRMGIQMSPEELGSYANTNNLIMNQRVHKLEQKVTQAWKKIEQLEL